MKIAVAWYRKDQWDLLKELAPDKEILSNSYEKWQSVVQRACKDFTRDGIIIVKTEVDVLVMYQWCQQRNIVMDGDARSHYASYLLSLQDL